MKISQLGLKPDESATVDTPAEGGSGSEEEIDKNTSIRFAKLHDVDIQYENYKIPNYGNSYQLLD